MNLKILAVDGKKQLTSQVHLDATALAKNIRFAVNDGPEKQVSGNGQETSVGKEIEDNFKN